MRGRGSSFAQTLRCLFPRLLLGHFNPNYNFFAVAVGLALGVFLARQEATGRIELLPQIHHLSRHIGLFNLAAGQVPHLVFVDQFSKIDISAVVVGSASASQQDIVTSWFGHFFSSAVRIGSTIAIAVAVVLLRPRRISGTATSHRH